jgi:hypothetical protein
LRCGFARFKLVIHALNSRVLLFETRGDTTITLGMQNVFDEDPPLAAGSCENGYDESLATIKGRFWYVQLKKRF